MYVRKEFILANVTAIVVNALLWLLVIIRIFSPALAVLLFALSVPGFILLSAKLNGLAIRRPKKRYPFHAAPTERVLIPLAPGRMRARRRRR